jgi:hypothetical protein
MEGDIEFLPFKRPIKIIILLNIEILLFIKKIFHDRFKVWKVILECAHQPRQILLFEFILGGVVTREWLE